MSIVDGTAAVYRGTFDGFIGSDPRGTVAAGGGVTGTFGDADNFVVITTVDGAVTAATEEPRATGVTGTYGDASNYPVVTITDGQVTAASTQPRLIATGVVAGIYGSEFEVPQLTINANGLVTAATTVPAKVQGVYWSATNSVAVTGGDNIPFTAVGYDTGDCIDEAVAGSVMTASVSGLYTITAFVRTTTTPGGGMYILAGASTVARTPVSAGVTAFSLCATFPVTAGDTISVGFFDNITTAASLRQLSVVRVA